MAFLKSLVILFILLLAVQIIFAQNSGITEVQQKFDAYQSNNFQEKIYMHTDKSAYLAGEIIWFKLYYTDAAQNKPLHLSKVAYVDVLDKDGKAIVQAKISLRKGRGSGSAFILLSAVSGNYKLRAYTAWMKNFGADQLFEKPISIINTLKNLDVSTADTAKAYAVQIFPEGGNLVNGIENKVALKLTGRNGKGIDFSGAVMNEKEDTITSVSTTIPFFGKADYSYALDVYTRFQTMEEVLREYVRPVNVVQRRGSLHMLLFDEAQRQFFEGGELVLLDGIPIFDKNRIFGYDPLKVKKLDVVTRKYFMGPTLFNGIASFTTYAGNFEGFQLDPRSIIIDYDGLQLEREFYAPIYETDEKKRSRVPDLRNTLLWKPHIELDKTGHAAIHFYTADQKGLYKIVAEGMDANGNAAAAYFQITVD